MMYSCGICGNATKYPTTPNQIGCCGKCATEIHSIKNPNSHYAPAYGDGFPLSSWQSSIDKVKQAYLKDKEIKMEIKQVTIDKLNLGDKVQVKIGGKTGEGTVTSNKEIIGIVFDNEMSNQYGPITYGGKGSTDREAQFKIAGKDPDQKLMYEYYPALKPTENSVYVERVLKVAPGAMLSASSIKAGERVLVCMQDPTTKEIFYTEAIKIDSYDSLSIDEVPAFYRPWEIASSVTSTYKVKNKVSGCHANGLNIFITKKLHKNVNDSDLEDIYNNRIKHNYIDIGDKVEVTVTSILDKSVKKVVGTVFAKLTDHVSVALDEKLEGVEGPTWRTYCTLDIKNITDLGLNKEHCYHVTGNKTNFISKIISKGYPLNKKISPGDKVKVRINNKPANTSKLETGTVFRALDGNIGIVLDNANEDSNILELLSSELREIQLIDRKLYAKYLKGQKVVFQSDQNNGVVEVISKRPMLKIIENPLLDKTGIEVICKKEGANYNKFGTITYWVSDSNYSITWASNNTYRFIDRLQDAFEYASEEAATETSIKHKAFLDKTNVTASLNTAELQDALKAQIALEAFVMNSKIQDLKIKHESAFKEISEIKNSLNPITEKVEEKEMSLDSSKLSPGDHVTLLIREHDYNGSVTKKSRVEGIFLGIDSDDEEIFMLHQEFDSENYESDSLQSLINDHDLDRFEALAEKFGGKKVVSKKVFWNRVSEDEVTDIININKKDNKVAMKNSEKAFADLFIEHSGKAAIRSGATLGINGLKAGLEKILAHQGIDAPGAKAIMNFFNTKFGEGVLRWALGNGIMHAPIDLLKGNEYAQKVAEELSISGLSGGMDQAADMLQQFILPSMLEAFKDTPMLENLMGGSEKKETSKSRIHSPTRIAHSDEVKDSDIEVDVDDEEFTKAPSQSRA